MIQEEFNKTILKSNSKEQLVNMLIEEHIKYNKEKYINQELKERLNNAIEYMNSEEFVLLMLSSMENNENYFKAKNKLLEKLKGE